MNSLYFGNEKIIDYRNYCEHTKGEELKQDTMDLKKVIIDSINGELLRIKETQTGLAEKVGVRSNEINQILNFKRPVSFQQLVDMANALNLKVSVRVEKNKK